MFCTVELIRTCIVLNFALSLGQHYDKHPEGVPHSYHQILRGVSKRHSCDRNAVRGDRHQALCSDQRALSPAIVEQTEVMKLSHTIQSLTKQGPHLTSSSKWVGEPD